jgi:PAS domain S-box-containing protein
LYADGLFSDITGRKQMEEAVRKATEFSRVVMDSITDAITIVDAADYRIIGCNRVFLNQVGLGLNDVVGRKCYALAHHLSEPCHTPHDICPMQETIATGNYASAEHVHSRENGKKYYAEVSTSPIFGENGKVASVVHVSRDITDRKLGEDKVRQLNAELEQKVEERTRQLLETQEKLVRKEKLAILGQLSGSVGHELRNPLGVMSNAVYFLKMVNAGGDETTREYLDIIKHEIDTSQRIITDLLDFARTKTPQTMAIAVSALLEAAIGKCLIPGTVELQTEIPGDLPLLRIDPLQMAQVLQNIISNSIQAMPNGGSLRISAKQKIEDDLQSGNFVAICVGDTGEGISPVNMKKLFQPLFTTKAKGIGLGLVVCKNLVEANGGRIEVESEAGKGTAFTVILPVCGEGI